MNFDYKAYAALVEELFAAGYQFEIFERAALLLAEKKPFVLMRHDVDLDLKKAYELALLEKKLGVKSTYFFMLRTEHYNVFSKEGAELIDEILTMGHEMGLHFDCAAYDSSLSSEDLGERCRRECQTLESWFSKKIRIISFHRPTALILSGSSEVSGGAPHTYEAIYTKQIHYCSDSRGEWKYGSPLSTDAFQKKSPLHILTHPIWWNEKNSDPKKSISIFIDRKFQAFNQSVAENCSVHQWKGASL